MGADSKSAAKSLLEAVTDIKTDGKETVIFNLSGANADSAPLNTSPFDFGRMH